MNKDFINKLLNNKILKNTVIVVFSLAFLYLIIFFVAYFFNDKKVGDDPSKFNDIQDFVSNSSYGKNDTGADINKVYTSPFSPKFGNKDGKIDVVMFYDFDCPFCKEQYSVIRRIMDKYKDSVYFEFRHMPIEDIHPGAKKLAMVSLCANEQDKFWQAFDYLYLDAHTRNQAKQSDEFYLNYGKTLGLDYTKFSNCYTSNKYESIINQDLINGVNFGIEGTPTYFVNGKKVSGGFDFNGWSKILDLAR